MEYEIVKEGKFKYIETSPGKERTLLLLHGLFGALSNFSAIIDKFKNKLNVVVPLLPIFELPLPKVTVQGLVDHVSEFLELKGYTKLNLVGNSLGGHIAIVVALDHPNLVRSLT